MQAREFYQMVNGYQNEEKRRDQKTAYFLSWLVNTQVTTSISVADILEPLHPGVREEAKAFKEQVRQKNEEAMKKEFAWALK